MRRPSRSDSDFAEWLFLTPTQRMALAEAYTSAGVKAGHVYKAAPLKALAKHGLLEDIYMGKTFAITPKGRRVIDAQTKHSR